MNNDAIRQFVRRELRAVTIGVATAIGIGGGIPAAIAGPGGGTVVAGHGSITNPNATTTLINQLSNQMTINWSSFNVASNETVRFVQPSSTSVALNNILGQSPSQIFGQIDANGRVVLINPNGILFGRTAQINVGSLIASSLELQKYDPATGHLSFQSLSGQPGVIDNEGAITAHGGSVALLGGTILNNGLVVADYGTVAMGAGTMATLDFYGGGLLRLQVNGDVKTNSTGAAAAVQNNGRIQANGGQVLLTAAATQDVFASAVNNSGVIRASRIENVGGVIELAGPDGVVANSGTLDASGKGAGSTGGTIKVTGRDVGLFAGSTINASGPAGGGTVLVGGGFHGADPSVEDASHTYVGTGTTITADATSSGNGGKVAVWSNDGTRYYGNISARGAGQGAGGFTEVSGKAYLDYEGQVNLQAPAGKLGTLLLDPTIITIEHGANGSNTSITTSGGSGSPFLDQSSTSGSVLTDGTIDYQLGTANVTVQTSGGDILISGTLGPTPGPIKLTPEDSSGNALAANGNTLTLNAAGNISWDAPWTYTNNGQLTLYASNGSIATSTTANTITLGGTSPLLMKATAGIGSGSVAIETIGLTSVAATNSTGGIYISNSGSGNVTVSSLSDPSAGAVDGLSTTGGSDISLTNSAGSITESGATITTTGALTTVSAGGTTLGRQNAVGTFNATNTGSGNVSLTNIQALTISGISQSGGGSVSVSNQGGTTLMGGVSAGTGSVTLADSTGTLALGANNVSGAGVTLQGVGITQSAGSTVDAGSADILVNGGGGAINMAGTLTTTSDSATAVTVQNASTVALPAITTGTTGTTTIGAGDITGAVSQSGTTVISTGTLTGDTQGTVTLSSATLPTLAAFTSSGFVLSDGDPLTITGTLAGGSGNVDLTSGTISEGGVGLISTTGTLTTHSTTGTTLGGQNAVGTFNATNTGSGSVSLTNTQQLTISGISQTVGGTVSVSNKGGTTLTGAVSAGTGSVTVADSTGPLALGANNVSGAGVTLQGVGITQSAASTVNAGSGNILVNAGGGAISMAGALTTTSNSAAAVMVQNASTVALPAITTGTTGTTTIGAGDISGAVTQSGSSVISTGTLTGDTLGTVSLGNATLPTVGAFTSAGFSLNDGDPLSITGALAGGSGGVNLTSSGAILESGGGLITTTGTLTANSAGGATLDGANMVSTFTATDATNGAVSLMNGSALTITGLDQSGGGSVSVTNSAPITLAGGNTATGGLTLSSTGDVTLGSAGSDNLTVTGTLSVTSGGSIVEQGGSSVVASSTLLDLTASTGDVTLLNAAAMGSMGLTGTGRNLDLESTTQGQINALLTGKTWSSAKIVISSAAVQLPNFSAGTLDVTAPGISQSGNSIIVAGATTLNSAGNPISLGSGSTSNSFGGNVAFTGSTVTLQSGGALSTSGAASGSLSEIAGGAISEGPGGIQLTGTPGASSATFTVQGAGSHDVNLSDASNNFNDDPTTITASGGSIGNVWVVDTYGTFVPLTLPGSLTTLVLSDSHAPIALAAETLNGGGSNLAGGSTALDVTAGGAITQTGALTVHGSSSFNAGANAVDLGNGGNSFDGNVAFTGSAVTLASSGALSSSGTASGNLIETAGGTISEGGSIHLTGVAGTSTASFTVTGSGATGVNLGNTSNNFNGEATTIVATGGGTVGNVTVADTNANFVPLALPSALPSLSLSDLNAPIALGGETLGGLDVTAGGPITQTGALVVNGTTTLTSGSGTGDITLDDLGNAFNGGITVDGGNVALANSAGTTFAGTSTVSNLTIASGGAVTEIGTLNVGNTTSIDAGSNDITLGQANSFGGNVAFTGHNVTLSTGPGDLASSGAASGNLTETSAGAITQGGALSVAGSSTLTTNGGAITLSDSANAFGGPVILNGGAVTLANMDGITLAGSDNVSSLTLDAGGTVTFGGATADKTIVAGDLVVQGLSGSGAAGGAVSQVGTLSVGGSASIDAGNNDITLGQANSFGGNVAFTGHNVTLSTGSGDLASSGEASGNLTEMSAGAITQGGTLTVAGNSTLTTNVGAITLSDSTNAFGGPVMLNGGAVTLANVDGITLIGSDNVRSLTLDAGGAVTFGAAGADKTIVAGDLVVQGLSGSGAAGGAVSQVGTLSVGGSASIHAGTSNITLANPANIFSGPIALTGGVVTLANSGSTTLSGANSVGSLTLDAGGAVNFGTGSTDTTSVANDLVVQGLGGSGAAGGAVNEAGPISVGGTTSIDAGTNDITLTQANTFGGGVTFTGNNVALINGGSLTTSGTASGTLTEIAKGASSNLNVGTLTAGGNVLLIAGGSILGSGSQSTLTANNVELRYGVENAKAQLGNPLAVAPASGSLVTLTVWAPQGSPTATTVLRQTNTSFQLTQNDFPAGIPFLVQDLYDKPFGTSAVEIQQQVSQAISSTKVFIGSASLNAEASDASGLGKTVLYIDWASYNPNISLFGTLNPAVCLPADQREEGMGSGSGSGCAAASASLLRPPAPVLLAMVPTREGWKAMPLFALSQ